MSKTMKFVVSLSFVALLAPMSLAKTPDGQTPAVETVCSGLSGAAFGLCNSYCEAQDCDVHDRPSCRQLRKNYAKLTGSPIFPCDARCGDGVVNQAGEECDGGVCENGSACNSDCTCPRCEPIIDADGTDTAGDGIPGAVEVQCGDAILALNETTNFAGLDTLNPALCADPFCCPHAWVFGAVGGDDIHLESPFDFPDGTPSTCPSASRNAVYDDNPDFKDCVVLDYDGSLFDSEGVCCDNACDPLLSFHDLNGNGWYDDGEDIVLDVNGNGIYD